jgi:hypothetical protein
MGSTSDFLTAASVETFFGATVAVYAVSNVLRMAFRLDRPYLPLLVALVVAFGLAINSGLLKNVGDVVVAILNGCLLFLSAAGLQQAGAAEVRGSEGGRRQGRGRVSWTTPWLHRRGSSAS